MYYSKIVLMLLIILFATLDLIGTENIQSQNSKFNIEQIPDSLEKIEKIIKNQLDSLLDLESVISYYPILNQFMNQLISKESDSVEIYSSHMKMLMTYSSYFNQKYQEKTSELYDQKMNQEISALIIQHKKHYEQITDKFTELCFKLGNNAIDDRTISICKSLLFRNGQQEFWNNIETNPSPYFDVTGLMDKQVNLNSFRGKNVLLHFWSTYSSPSINELALLLEINKNYSRNGLKIISINADKINSEMDIDVLKNFVIEMNLNWHHIADGNERKIMDLYFIRDLPKLYLIDEQGFIVYHCNSLNNEELQLILSNLFIKE